MKKETFKSIKSSAQYFLRDKKLHCVFTADVYIPLTETEYTMMQEYEQTNEVLEKAFNDILEKDNAVLRGVDTIHP